MIDTRSQLLDYVRPSLESLWHWEDDGTVLAWHDGNTIAFREEVVEILESLAPRGLPPFEGVVLLLAACQGLIPQVVHVLGEPPANQNQTEGSKAQLRQASRIRRETQVKEDLGELRRLAALPRELIKPLRSKRLLADAVFEDHDPHPGADGIEPADLLSLDLTSDDLNGNPEEIPEGNLLKDLHWVAKGIRRQTEASLRLRLRTGLDELPQPLDPGLPPSEAARQLLAKLLQNPDQQMLARAAQELRAAIRLPHRLWEHDDSAVGGVSDLSNRGPLDRLLLSELAHDDLTLTTRIALNEALFLRRDPPEHEPASDLAVLLDCGLRMWGLPRVFATAAALAMVANGSHTRAVRVWRAGRKGITSVDLLHQAGLLAHLEVLEPDIHPGGSLRSFQQVIHEHQPPLQSVLITQQDTLGDPSFRSLLERHGRNLAFVATVSRDGRFALHAPPFLPRQAMCESQLDVDRLFPNSGATTQAGRAQPNPELPAFIQQTPAPLRLPLCGKVSHWTRESTGSYLAVMSDRRLVRYQDREQGGALLIQKVPPGKTLWLESIDATVCLLKAGSPQRPCRLLRLEPSGPPQVTELGTGLSTVAACRSGNALLVIREGDVCAYSLRDGQPLDRSPSPSRWHRGRFFSSLQKFHFVSWDGGRVRFEPVSFPSSIGVSSVVTIFDREGCEGPWVLNQLCQIISLASGERFQIPLPIGQSSHRRNVHVSRDGHRVYLTIPDLNWHSLFDLTTGKGEIMRAPLDDLEALDPAPPLPQWNLLKNIEAVSGSLSAGLRIRSRKGTERILELDEEGRLRFIETSPTDASAPFLGFNPVSIAGLPKAGQGLESALWPSGSRAFLDQRGLLHLKSGNPRIPEISLVLSESEVAGWNSDQIVCGSDFFLRPGQSSDALRVYRCVQDFLHHL
jgi:hypothetical protein